MIELPTLKKITKSAVIRWVLQLRLLPISKEDLAGEVAELVVTQNNVIKAQKRQIEKLQKELSKKSKEQ